MQSARIIMVIETKSPAGEGTRQDLVRPVIKYWDLDGNLLAINDPCNPPKIIKVSVENYEGLVSGR